MGPNRINPQGMAANFIGQPEPDRDPVDQEGRELRRKFGEDRENEDISFE